MYFISLDDDYLQKEVSDLKTANPNIKGYFDEVVSAEGRLKAFNDITKSSTNTEGSGVTVSYLNSKTGNKAGNKNGNKTGAKTKRVESQEKCQRGKTKYKSKSK